LRPSSPSLCRRRGCLHRPPSDVVHSRYFDLVNEETQCPAWCVAYHAAEDEGTARHRGAIVDVPVVASSGAVELMIEMHMLDGETVPWVYVGDGVDRSIEISRESVARLARALVALPP